MDTDQLRADLLKMDRELQIARQIQASFLPETLPELPGWELAARFQPAREVAGDFYDAFTLTNNRRIGVVIADVCDKGVGAALFMALFRTLIRAFAQQHYSLGWADALSDFPAAPERAATPGERRRRGLPSIGTVALKNAVTLTNSYICANHGQTAMFATLFFGVIDPATGAVAYVNCGHNPPLLLRQGGHERLPLTGPALGILPEAEFGIRNAQMEPGDFLLLYTDGVTEARDPAGGFYGEERLLEVTGPRAHSAAALLDRLEASVRAVTRGADQSDDITLLAVRRREG